MSLLEIAFRLYITSAFSIVSYFFLKWAYVIDRYKREMTNQERKETGWFLVGYNIIFSVIAYLVFS
ncbi:hypothetical protein BCR25_04915 [Enterococcus termitis]|uniref:Uncharacterized protein n=1 Tax=Enterococcus termitis TaxID=332950 RepID=A0A1E5GJH7_9ENTE|nr:hypothetical protein BCR25_04915 [Enterococcus termitis]